MSKCKITVLKCDFHKDLAGQYLTPKFASMRCPYFAEGEEFIVTDHPGEGFCETAWNDIYKSYLSQMERGEASLENLRPTIACCTDGVKPVIFKLEYVDQG